MDNKLSWSFSQVWNESLQQRDSWKYEPRGHIWASELGKPIIDRWYKMKGTEPTNPPNARSLRKFEAGNVFEWITEIVLKRAGVLIDTQEYVKYQYDKLPEVTGKLDHLAGGNPDWDAAKKEFSNGEFPDFIKRAANDVIDHFSLKYPKGMREVVLEIKSVGSLIFHRYETYKQAEPTHALQLFHYLKAKDMPEGHIIYISKDDLMLEEIGIFKTPDMEEKYITDIKLMAEALKSDKPPAPEPEIVLDPITGKFRANWKVGYSQYLTEIYDYETQADFDAENKPKVAKWNRVLGRVIEGKNMTDHNKAIIAEIKKEFDENFDSIVEIAKSAKPDKSEETSRYEK